VKATDNGVPARSSSQWITISVKEPPPPAKEPVKFDVASQSVVTALLSGKNRPPEAWVLSKTDGKNFTLRKGDPLKLGGIEGFVTEVGANYVEFETQGRRWLVGLDESIADAYQRGQTD
jgi:hypothetical protein